MMKKAVAATFNRLVRGFKPKWKVHAVKKSYTNDYLFAVGFRSEYQNVSIDYSLKEQCRFLFTEIRFHSGGTGK